MKWKKRITNPVIRTAVFGILVHSQTTMACWDCAVQLSLWAEFIESHLALCIGRQTFVHKINYPLPHHEESANNADICIESRVPTAACCKNHPSIERKNHLKIKNQWTSKADYILYTRPWRNFSRNQLFKARN